MKNKIKNLLPLLCLLCIPVLNIFYMLSNRAPDKINNLVTQWDRITPFVPAFVIPYILWTPFVISMFVLLCFKNRSMYYRSIILMCVGQLTCFAIYYFFQTTTPRPMITGDGYFSQLVVNMVYANDQPYNCFPSIHVLNTYIILKAITQIELKKVLRIGIVLFSWSIIFSTVFIKQHVLLDIVGAVVLIEGLYYILSLLIPINRSVEKQVRTVEAFNR